VVFFGLGKGVPGGGDIQGIYALWDGTLVKVADTQTTIPGMNDNFTSFLPAVQDAPSPIAPAGPAITGKGTPGGGDVVAFVGKGTPGGGDIQGIFLWTGPSSGQPSGNILPIVDSNAIMPDGNGQFTFFNYVALDGANTAFVGGGNNTAQSGNSPSLVPNQGVWKDIGNGWQTVADFSTPLPAGAGSFSLFGPVAIAHGFVVFEGFDDRANAGLYTDFDGALHKIVAVGDVIGGKKVTALRWGQGGFIVNAAVELVFAADFTDGSQAVTRATLTTGPCPLGQGFWKNHTSLWPVSPLTLGSQSYTKTELLALLKTSTTSDASLILARQLIAAKLNVANGSDSKPVSTTIADADTLLIGFPGKLPYKVKTSSALGQPMVNDATVLNDYNNSLLQAFCGP
jgi:hypothetical protein